jgi:transcriptional regulator with XRE-family HTH domain
MPADRMPLAHALRDLRQQAGLSTYELAQRLGWSQSVVSRTERGVTAAGPADVREWCSATGAPEAQSDSLISAAEALATQTRSYRQAHSRGLARRQQDIGEVIASSSRYRAFGLAEVPGLLQTPLYAAKILEIADVSGQRDIREAVAARMNRQALLYDPARSFEFVIAEWAFEYRAGPPDVMRGQAAKIIDAMTLPNVFVGIVPRNADPGVIAITGFVIYEPPDGPWVLVEHLTGETDVRAREDVAVYEQTFAGLREAAVTGKAAESVMRALMTR